jgi:mRNA interferase RelE/StbE
MASYELTFRKSVAKDLRDLPKQDVKKILQRIRSLSADPRPADCEKLSGQERYRVRQGLYRIVYEIDDRVLIVLVVKVGHRRDVYRAQ